MVKVSGSISEKSFTKGELRKLNALRKSLGDEIAEEAFVKWKAAKDDGDAPDPNVEMIEEALAPLMDKVRITRGGGYAIRRGRGRFIIEPVEH